MTPTKLNRAPLTKRISALAITAAAALSFAVFSPNAQAAVPAKPTKEFNALAAELTKLGTNIDQATPEQLATAVSNAISEPANVKLKPGNIAGEALKYAANQTAGDEIGLALITANAGDGAADTLAARDAIKRAGSGKGLNVNMVPDFAAQFVATNADAIALAKMVISTKPGAGAVIGGRAGELATDDLREALAIEALAKTAKLTAAATDIAKYVIAAVEAANGDTAASTHDIAVANTTLGAKIGTGGVAGDPTNGGDIVDALLSETNLPKLKTGVAGFIKSVAKVADIEEISKIGVAVAEQIGTASTIKFSKANGVVKSLAKAIMAKATTQTIPNSTPDYSFDNKQDEIAEVVAFMIGNTLNSATLGGAKPQITEKNAGAKILALIKSAVNATKGKKVANAAGTGFFLDVARDVTGSVAETLSALKDSTIPASVALAIRDFLVKKASSIAGKANAGAIIAAIDAAYETGASEVDINFEDGTIAENVDRQDPGETDYRPF